MAGAEDDEKRLMGKRVRAARKSMSPPLTQDGLALEASVSTSYIQQIERGADTWPGRTQRRFDPEPGQLMRIATVLYPAIDLQELLLAWGHDPDLVATLTVDQDRVRIERQHGRTHGSNTRQQQLRRIYKGLDEHSARLADEIVQVVARSG